MKNRFLTAVITFLVFAFLIVPVSAQNSSDSARVPGEKLAQKKLALETRRDNLGDRLDNLRTKIASRQAELKKRLSLFKDTKKAQKIEKINFNLNKINENQTARMDKNLDKMSEILTKLENRKKIASDSAEASTAATALNNARVAIASGEAAVAAQMAKDYTVTISTESAAKTDVKKVRDQLHADLKATNKIVIEAKHTLAKAISTLSSLIKGDK